MGQIHLFPEQQILPSYFNLLYFWQVISRVGEQIKITMLPNMKYKDFLTGYLELFSWWIYFNLIFAMQVTERNDIEWFAILQSKHRNGVYCTISIDSAVTRHRACGLGRIRSPVPRHNLYGQRLLVDPKNSQKGF